VDEFLWLGEYVSEGHYQDMPFTRYKRERGQTARP
ncbi:MAG: thioredoxin, partial [Gammaproteobacteria bacterium]